MDTASKQQETLRALGVVSKNSAQLGGVADSILEHLVSKTSYIDRSEMKKSLRHDLLQGVYQDYAQSGESTVPIVPSSQETHKRLQREVLSSLHYNGMEDRQGRIAEAFESTFEWVLRSNQTANPDWYNLPKWLESEDQLYWITGKAGSGKSTLMKFLCQPLREDGQSVLIGVDSSKNESHFETRCLPFLEAWAGNKKLHIASFYFWISGNHLQKTRTGLLRSLLYQILRREPELIPSVSPSRWESMFLFGVHEPWKDVELEVALTTTVQSLKSDSRICFFVDGLDEFDGAHDSLLSLLQNLLRNNIHVKCCVASRPWVLFQDAFETKPHLRIESLTYNDIKHYVTSKFTFDPEFSKLQVLQPEFASQLIENIIAKASGVFLWVSLVVASLLAGMSFGDRIADLQKRLDGLPPDLEKLYDNMLRSLDPFYLEHATQLLLIMEASKDPISLILMSFADEETTQSVTDMPAKALSASVLSLRADAMARRLNSRWKGLLEVKMATGSTGLQPHQTVQYLHRSVSEFIQSSKVQAFMQSSLKQAFDPHLSLCIAEFAYMKAIPSRTAPAEVIRSCLYHASKVLPDEQKHMILILDSIADVLPKMYKLKPNTPAPVAARYLGIEWGQEKIQGEFGDNFLSLAVIHGVTSFVKARVEPGCLADKPGDIDAPPKKWPLLRDAFATNTYSLEIVECLLERGADPNYPLAEFGELTPWRRCLIGVSGDHSHLKSLTELSKESQSILRIMVKHGADVDAAWRYYVPKQTNRFGSRVPIAEVRGFADQFFKELNEIPRLPKSVVSQKEKQSKLRIWRKRK